MARAKKNNKTLIIVVYLLLAVSCLVWLAAYTFYFRQNSAAGEGAGGLAALTESLPPEESAGIAEKTPVPPPPASAAPAPKNSPAAAQPQPRGRPALPARARAETESAGRRPSAAVLPPKLPVKGKIAVILDDAGYQNTLLKTYLELPGKLTVSVLPGLSGSAEAARMTRAARKEMMLHLPLEPQHGENPGPDAILSSMNGAQIRRLAEKHIDSLPGITGVNNHMGSRATEDVRVMRDVLGLIKERGLYFIDSRTTARSAGPALARELGLRCRERSVFLDNEEDEVSIRKYFDAGKAVSAKQGWAIMIGHVWCAELARLLPELYAASRAEGFEFVFASELFAGGN